MLTNTAMEQLLEGLEALAETTVLTAMEGLDDFLRDPIGFGEFDYNDPIGLDDFMTPRMHQPYADVLT